MYRIIYLLIMIAVTEYYAAQTHRFIYELEIHKIVDTVKVNMALDINKDFVKFYDYEFVKQDSIRKSGNLLQYFSPSDQIMSRKRDSFENKMFFSFGFNIIYKMYKKQYS